MNGEGSTWLLSIIQSLLLPQLTSEGSRLAR
jgi:hypothetical protein